MQKHFQSKLVYRFLSEYVKGGLCLYTAPFDEHHVLIKHRIERRGCLSKSQYVLQDSRNLSQKIVLDSDSIAQISKFISEMHEEEANNSFILENMGDIWMMKDGEGGIQRIYMKTGDSFLDGEVRIPCHVGKMLGWAVRELEQSKRKCMCYKNSELWRTAAYVINDWRYIESELICDMAPGSIRILSSM